MRLPRHLNPALTLAELIHGHVGLVVAIPYMAMQIGGSALAYVPLNQLGNSAIPNYTTALRPVTYWGAVAVDAGFGMMVIYTYLQNTSVMDHLSGVAPRNAEASHKFRGFSNLALLSGLAVFVGVLLSYPSGTYTLSNMVPYFGPAIAIGFTVPDLYSWTIPCLWSFAAAAAAYALHLLTWNVNGLATSDFEKFVASVAKDEEADDVETQQWIASHMKTA
jgi:glycerol uptake facilitator-like aquaporin